MKQPIIAITGANGQLGKCFHDISEQYPVIRIHFLGREHCNIGEFELTNQVMQTLKPTVVINAAAYTAVDKAEAEPGVAFHTNAFAVGNLAKVCKLIGAKLLHVSTDYVFDGTNTTAYQETDPVKPINVYGASKQKGEELALAENDQTAIIRTSWVYSRHGNNFVKTMLRLMPERESIGVVNDQTGSPTYAVDLAETLMQLALAENFVPGIYHYSNAGSITWWQFAEAICKLKAFACQVNPLPTTAFPTPAKRPVYSVMDCHKIQNTFGINQKPWQESLEACLNLL